MDNELLVKTIRTLCKDNNISVSQLESDLSFGAGLISRWTKSSPSLDKIIDIADYFHVTLDEVVGRNKKLVDENYEFINLIIEQTKNGQLQWDDYFNQPYQGDRCDIPEEINYVIPNFNKYPNYQRRIEKFFTKSPMGYMMLSCYLILENDIIDRYELFFYVQPKTEEQGIIQKCNQEQLLNLFKIIDATINGTSPEIIANDFKSLYMKKYFINNYQESLNKVIQTKVQMDDIESDPTIVHYLAQLDTPELQQLLTIYTDPKMLEALNNTHRIIQFLNKVKFIQSQQKSSKAKTFNEILTENNENTAE